MAWDESKHPRDDDGKFIDGTGAPRTFRQNTSYRDIIRLQDEQLPRSVGAKWRNHEIRISGDEKAKFVEGSKLQNKEIFAGKGCKRKIDCIDYLISTYGGNIAEWVKVKAIAEIQLPNGEIIKAEVHWYEEPSVGKVEIKLKRSL